MMMIDTVKSILEDIPNTKRKEFLDYCLTVYFDTTLLAQNNVQQTIHILPDNVTM